MWRFARRGLPIAVGLAGSALMGLVTIDLTAATSLFSKNLALLGLVASPVWLQQKATDGWLFGLGLTILVTSIVWATWTDVDPVTRKRSKFKKNLFTLSVWTGTLVQRLQAASADDDIPALVEEADKLGEEAYRWLTTDMGMPAYGKYISGSYRYGDVLWAGTHSPEVSRKRTNLILLLQHRAKNLEDLIRSDHWDPVEDPWTEKLFAKAKRWRVR